MEGCKPEQSCVNNSDSGKRGGRILPEGRSCDGSIAVLDLVHFRLLVPQTRMKLFVLL